MTKEERYLEKINNDIEESLFDLLVMHLSEIGSKVKLYDSNAEEMISLLEKALLNIKNKLSDYNKLFMYRYMLLCINKILLLDKSRKDMKELKKKIIADFTHEDAVKEGLIPLNSQFNEIRITYDVSYLIFLVEKFVNEENYAKALYCFEAIKLIEPDNDVIDKYSELFNSKFPIVKHQWNNNKGSKFAVDSNIVIDMIRKGTFLDNIVIVPSVIKEVKEHMKYLGYNSDKLKQLIDKYGYTDEINIDISKIKDFYSKRIPLLRTILLNKLSREKCLSHKLRRLARRENLLPEQGDMEFLAECIELNLDLYSLDADFQYFANDIEQEFGIRVVSGV
jgi:hypothetical protein